MKIKEGFILRTVAGENVIIPSGDTMDLNMMITVNKTGRFLWEHMRDETTKETLIEALLTEYDVEEATARAHVDAFVQKLEDNDFLA